MKKIVFILTVISLLSSAVTSLYAFQFSPISQDFNPVGQGTNQTFRVTNDTGSPIAVQVDVFHREMDSDGNEELSDASNLFTIFPKQSVVQPDSYQTVYVRWNRQGQIENEEAFRIVARQLPVDFSPEGETVNIKILMVYKGTIYIVPQNISHDISIVGLERVIKDNDPYIKIILENTGNTHTFLENPKLTITSGVTGSSQIRLGPEQLEKLTGENILAEHTRQFFIPWPDGLEQGELDAALSADFYR
ncbi:MAG: fimbria/pilus periplasmic chaperone [Spirochaetia bacterium]|nr:fimbria/pilus periplasmic chaperone [Spirochaetia bacterium]